MQLRTVSGPGLSSRHRRRALLPRVGGAEEGVGAVVTTEELLVRLANQSLLNDMLTALTCVVDEFDRDGRDDIRDSTPGPPCA
jgi:hypothetical protein